MNRIRTASYTAFAAGLALACDSGTLLEPASGGSAGSGGSLTSSAGSDTGPAAGGAGGAGKTANGGSAPDENSAGAPGTPNNDAGPIVPVPSRMNDAGAINDAGSVPEDASMPPAPEAVEVAFCTTALQAAVTQLDGFRAAYTDPARIPRAYEDGDAHRVAPSDWTSGFVAGSFWLLYEYTQDSSWRTTAEQWTAALEAQQNNTSTHDVGFMMFSSFGNGLRLTGNAAYEPILVQSAESLMTRYNATVGATRSWSWNANVWSFPVIVDNMMNLELLYFAANSTKDAKFSEAATTHAVTTLANHFRPDHSSYHLVDYNPETGAVVSKQTRQGLADESDWARGQAWGLYGFTAVHRYTGEPRFLDQAVAIAEFFLDHPNLPEDKVPYFDFDVVDYPNITNHRDASAAAVAASALLELSQVTEEPRAARFRDDALHILRSLSSPSYAAAPGTNGHFLLMHSVGSQPEGSEVDVALNYADYYYLEALLRCAALNN